MRLIKRHEVEQLTGLGRSSIYALMMRGSFPRAVKLGPKSVAWPSDEIDEWIARKIAERRDSKVAA